MAKPRKLENLSYYEWSVTRWITSRAYEELDATGRGIYREMLDCCYIQGSVSSEPAILERRCACTTEELQRYWPIIEPHFYRDRQTGRLRNKHADKFREEYLGFLERQGTNGAKGGRPPKNPGLSSGFPSGFPIEEPTGLQVENPAENPKLNYTKQDSTKPSAADRAALLQAFNAWIETYPKQTRTAAAGQAWILLVDKSEISIKTLPDVIAGTDRWKKSEEWAKEDGKYIPEPATFLTGNEKHPGRMWKDFPKPLPEHAPKKRTGRGVDPNEEWEIPAEWKALRDGETEN